MARLIIVSNRSPITARLEDGVLRLDRSPGGLTNGLREPHARGNGLWVGWPGLVPDLDGVRQELLEERLAALRIVPVRLGKDEVDRYYHGFCNTVLWPLFHNLLGHLPLLIEDFDVYEAVNARFADAVARCYRPGDLVWVHDYQLMRVPALVRERLPQARIGFFLHIPFPPTEAFSALPGREQLLEGLLGADLIGFHAAAYARHFVSTALGRLDVAADGDRLEWDARSVRLGVFPMGADAAGFATAARKPEVLRQVAAIRGSTGVRLLVGIDRLDYTKGIPHRLLAFEQLLRAHPELRERVRLIQVAVPSRTTIPAYRELREQVETLVGRINGVFATGGWAPIEYVFRTLSQDEVAALYRAADAMLVTPICDGMNLVAKEFVASRSDERGVLVLSEFAGAAAELSGSIQVNPYDTVGTAQAFYQALTLPEGECRTRMRALRRRVLGHDVHRWVSDFVDELQAEAPVAAAPAVPFVPARPRDTLDRLRAAHHLVLLLDYDGTLVPLADAPELAPPDEELLELLRGLAARPGTAVHVVSGRDPDTLERWLGALPIGLHAEHGLWRRRSPAQVWTPLDQPTAGWRRPALAILRDFAARTPGALVEEKSVGAAWHFRMADAEDGAARAEELTRRLTTLLAGAAVDVLPGRKVIELRPHGVHKGRVVPSILAEAPAGCLAVALGDDRTDEDLFAALPPGAVTIHIGPGPSAAAIRLATVLEARRLLGALLTPAGGKAPGSDAPGFELWGTRRERRGGEERGSI